MAESDYLYQIQVYENKIADYQDKIQSIKRELDEAEESLINARKYSTKFYNAVDNKKSKRNELSIANSLKALIGWTNQLDDLFNGSRFKKVDNGIQTMISNIKEEIRRLSEELDYYEGLLGSTENKLANTRIEHENFRHAEAARQEAAKKQSQSQNKTSTSKKSNSSSKKKKDNGLLDDLFDFFR